MATSRQMIAAEVLKKAAQDIVDGRYGELEEDSEVHAFCVDLGEAFNHEDLAIKLYFADGRW